MKNNKNIIKLVLGIYLASVVISIPMAIYSFRNTKYQKAEVVTSRIVQDADTSKKVSKLTPTATIKQLPVSYKIDGGKHMYQTFNNCGPASLSMTLSFFGIDISQDELGGELRPYQVPNGDNDDKSVSLEEVAEKSRDFGFVPYLRPYGDIETMKAFISNDIPVIARTITKVGEDIGHYRVVFGYDERDGELIQNDSLQGKNLEYSYEDFKTLWRSYGYEYLVLVPKDKVEIAEEILGEDLDEQIAWQNALKRLQSDVQENPNDEMLKFALSVAYYNVSDYENSIRVFEEVEDDLPFRTLWYQTEPLLAYQKLGLYAELLPRIEEILENGNRAYSELYQIRGEVYLSQGRIEDAKRQFELALQYNKNFDPARESLRKIEDL